MVAKIPKTAARVRVSKKSTKVWEHGGSGNSRDGKDGSGKKKWGWKHGGGGSSVSKDRKDVRGKKSWGGKSSKDDEVSNKKHWDGKGSSGSKDSGDGKGNSNSNKGSPDSKDGSKGSLGSKGSKGSKDSGDNSSSSSSDNSVCEPKKCYRKLDVHGAGSKEHVNVDLGYGCDFDGDHYNDIRICLKIDEKLISSTCSEDLIGVAFDLYKDAHWREDVEIRDVAIIAPDHVPSQDPHKWVIKAKFVQRKISATH